MLSTPTREGQRASDPNSPARRCRTDGGSAGYNPDVKRKRKRRSRGSDEGSYVCPSRGEPIEIPVDPTQGSDQQYVEDCPVCCNPNVIRVEYDPAWEAPRVWAEAE
jgi:hypothetical protein